MIEQDEPEDYDNFDEDDGRCMSCGGDGIMDQQEAEDDYINYGPGEWVKCPNCGGSGLAKDQQYW